ncbi:MAG TPA: hypothetical protein DCQ06_10680, partial [Myxococcales bacterium]|nr:hypothetical protein [Myxococcales bacterium]
GGSGSALTITMRRGKSTSCSSIATGTVEYAKEYVANNKEGLPHVIITAQAPSELASSGMYICFKPDGRVVRYDTEQPFSAPVSGWFAGDVYFELQRSDGTSRIGSKLQVKIGYNGSAGLTHGLNLSKLQGGQ